MKFLYGPPPKPIAWLAWLSVLGAATASSQLANTRPAVDSISDQTIPMGTTVTVIVVVTDADADDTHTINANSDDADVATVSVSGKTLTLTGVESGKTTITVTATDDSSATNDTSEEREIRVMVNSRPVVDPISDRAIPYGVETKVMVSVADGDEGDAHTVAANSSDADVATVSVSGKELTLMGMSAGRATITVTARDDSDAANARSFEEDFDVFPNYPPTVEVPPFDYTVEAGAELPVLVFVSDPNDQDRLQLYASSDDTAIATVEVTSLSTLNVTGVSGGATTIAVWAIDNSEAENDTSETVRFAVAVTDSQPENHQPVVAAIADQTVANGASDTVTVAVTDADADDTHAVEASSDATGVATVSVSGKTLTLTGVSRGEAMIEVTATDNSGATNATSAEVTFTATVPNSRPAVGAISDLTVSRGSTGARTASVTDGDTGDTHEVSASSSATGVATVSVNGKTVTVRGVSRGEATITVTATDNSGATNATSAEVTFTATVPNSRPAVGAISDLTVSRGSTGARTASVTDGDTGDTHEVSASSSATGVATVSVNGKTVTVRGVSRGEATITVTATDNSGATNATSAEVTFTATVPNSRPAVGAISDLTVSRGSTGARTASVTDGDTGDTHEVSASSSATGVATVSVNGKTVTVRGVSRGEATITVTATDNSGESNDMSLAVRFDVEVEVVNSRPVVGSISDTTVSRGSTRSVTVSVTDGDSGDTHTVWSSSDATGVATVPESGNPVAVTGVSRGTATIEVTARDNSGAANDTSLPVEFDVTVPNSRPAVGAISDLTVSRGSTGTRTATVRDGDTGDTHTVSARSDDTSVATVSVSGKTLTVRGVSCGAAAMSVTTTDNSGASNDTSAAVTFWATVPNSRPAVGSISDLTVSRGSMGTRTATVTDGDSGDTHTVLARSDDTSVATVSVSGKTLTVRGVSRGAATITVTAADGCATSAAVRFDVTVPNSRPVVGSISDATVSPGSTATRTATVTDGDTGDTHTVSATSGDTSAATVSVNGKTLTVRGASRGRATMTVTARDNSGASNDTSTAVEFDVTVPNSRPAVAAIADRELPRGSTDTETVVVTDRDSGDTHAVSANSDDSAVTVTVSGKTLTLTGVSRGAPTITVTARDDSGASNDTAAAAEFDVTVPNSRPAVGPFSDRTVARGSTDTETVVVRDADTGDMHTVEANSDAAGVATVTVSGKTMTVTGVSRGEATISVTATDDSEEANDTSLPARFDATVPNSRPVVGSISALAVSRGSTATETVAVTDGDSGDAHAVEASSDDESVATVEVSGKTLTLRGVSRGEATITVTATDDSEEANDTSAAVEFEVAVPNSRPAVDLIESLLVETGADLAVAVSVTDADPGDAHTIAVSSSDVAVATAEVSEDGTELTLAGVSAGEATIAVTATDDSGAPNGTSEARTFAVTVNDRSEVSPIPDRTLEPGSTATLAVTITDADGTQSHEVAAESDDAAVATAEVSEDGTELTLTGVSAGEATIEVTATDDSGAPNAESEPATFAVIVNTPPEVNAIAARLVETGEDLAVAVVVTDPDSGQSHALAAVSDDPAVATAAVSGMELTLSGISAGSATITVTATDDSGGSNAKSAPATFAVTVNAQPEVDPIADLTVAPAYSGTATVSVTDADSGQSHALVAESDDTAVATVAVSGLELTVAGVLAGTATIEVKATDDSGAPNAESEPGTLAVTVNTRPELEAIEGLTIAPSSTETLAVAVTDPDADQTHALAAESSDDAVATAEVSEDGTELTLTGVSAGEAMIEVTATDDSGGFNAESAPATFAAIVNTQPVVEPIEAQSINMDSGTATVSMVVTDPDAGQTHEVAAESSEPAVATVEVSADGTELTLTGVAAGGAMISVTATDDSGGTNAESEAVSFEVSVSNSQPVVTAPVDDQTLTPGEGLALAVTVTDADADDAHTVEAASSDESVATAAVSEDGTELTLTAVSAGEATIEVTATDDSGADNAASEPAEFVARVNTRPVVGPFEAQSIKPGGEPVVVAVTVTDPDADQEHEVTAESDDTAVEVEVSEDGTELTLTASAAGEATITVTATDDSEADNAASEPAEFAVVSNAAPAAEDDMASTGEYAAVDIDVLANDADPDGQALRVESVGDGAHGTTAISGGAVTYMPELGFRGIDIFTYTVTDGFDTDEAEVWVWVDVLVASPNPSYTGSYALYWAEPPRPDVAAEVWETAGGASERVFVGTGTSKRFSRRPEGTYTYRLRFCDAEGECLAMPEPHLEVEVMFSPETPIQAANATGNIPYQTGVTKGGDGYIHIPLVPVPGVNGLQPRLSFDYSGGRDRQRVDKKLPGDILGYGWHVGGFSAIRWCVTNQARTQIAFTRDDNLCLDGEPLVLAEGTHLNYGAEYRTLRDTYAKIVLRRSDTPSTGWFEARMPDGTVREYGRTADSNLVHADANGRRTFVWSVNKETDAFGNEMTYEYHEDEASLARHPRRIAYGDGGDAEILFEYAGRGDIATVMAGGLEQVQWLRVHSVDVRLNSSTVRKYLLESEVTTEGWVRLRKLQMCAYRTDGAQECPAPFLVKWMDIAEGDAVPIEKTCVSKLADPLGVETKFTYETLTEKGDHDFLIHADDAPFGDVIAPAGVRALPATASDDMDTGGNIKPIVTRVARTNGVGGEHVMKYAYLVEDGEDKPRGFESTLNWGFLGFYAIRETDAESGIATYTQYRLDYPHFGKPAAVAQYDREYTTQETGTLWKRHMTYDKKTIRHASRNRTDIPHVRFETALIYEGGTRLGATQTRYALELTSDGYPESLERTTKAGHSVSSRNPPANRGSYWGNSRVFTVGGLQRRTITTTRFHNRTGTHWLIGFVNEVTVTHGTGDAERTMETDLTAEGDTNAVDTATRFPGNMDLEFKTDYRYDNYGNRDQAVVTAKPASRRETLIDGFAAARYPMSITNPEGHVESLEHDARLGLPTKVTDANNRVARLEYDALGRQVERIREWDGDATTMTSYDSCTTTTCNVTVAAGKCSFDESRTVAPAMVSVTTSPTAPTTKRYFDKLGRLIRTEVDAFAGDHPRRADAFYDARGRLACESAPYHADETPHYTTYEYDVRDRVTAVTRPDGGSTAIGYTADGHRVKATITETVKEEDGTVSDTRESARLHNLLGELVEATDGAEQALSANKVTTTYAIDTSGLLTTVTADGVATSFEYDAAGNRASVTNPDMGTAADGKSVKFEYTGLGQVSEREDGRGTMEYTYDKLGRQTQRVEKSGTGTVTGTAIWSYDPANGKGRLASRSYGGAAFSETYTYGSHARLERVDTSIGGTAGPFVTRHAYDGLGRPSTTTHPSGLKVERGYSARGYLETLTDATAATKKTLVTYRAMDAHGNIETERFGNGAETTRGYDPKTGRPESISTTRGTLTFQNHAYAWRTDGSLESRTANAAGSGTSARALREEEFDYDYLGRLDSAARKLGGAMTASRTLDYTYDRRGNLTSKTSDVMGDKNVTATMYGQGSAGPHALTRATVGDVVNDLRYDPQGHVERYDAASGDDKFIEWDVRGLAAKVTVGTAKDAAKPKARETFRYGPGGARYLKTSEWRVGDGDSAVMKSETTHYVGAFEKRTRACVTGEGESETASTQSVERTRVGPVLHVKRYACGSTAAPTPEIEYRHFDHLGSPASITDAAGSELVALAHDPHGERRKADWTRRLNDAEIESLGTDHGDRTSRGFTGHEQLDRTGLVHMNGRLYDPLLGRFLSPDPVVANPADGQQWNLYSYAMNSPLSYIDPSGLSFCDPAQQSWCGGVGVPGSGWGGGGGYGTRTVSGWGVYVTFGIYYEIVRIWQSASVSRWDADVEGGGSWGSTDDTFWEDVQRTVIRPIVHWFFWSFQVVEQGVANEPAGSHSAGVAGHGFEFEDDWTDNWFSRGKHGYVHVSPPICQLSTNCTLERIIRSVNETGVHPNQTTPFVPGEDYIGDVDFPGPWGADEVTTTAIYDESGVQIGVQNVTLKNHPLDPGIVRRQVIQIGSSYHILTRGEGEGPWGGPNVWFDEITWSGVDQHVLDDFR